MKRVGFKLRIVYHKRYKELYKHWFVINKFIHLKDPFESATRNVCVHLEDE